MRWSRDGWICRSFLAFIFATAEERSDLPSLFFPCPSPSPPFPFFRQHNTLCVCVYMCVFVFTKEPICWFLVYVLFVFCLARSLTEQIKACCSSGKEQKKNRKSLCLSEGLTRLSYTGILSSSSSSLSVYESQAGCYFG